MLTVENLERSMASSDPEVRRGAVLALGMMGGQKAERLIDKALCDEDKGVRKMAALATVRRGARNPRGSGFRWGKTDWSQGPLKTPAQVRALAKRLRAKRSPRARDAANFAERYVDAILAQPKLQQDLLDTERTSMNPRRRTMRNMPWVDLTTYEGMRASTHCDEGDFYLEKDEKGYWVGSWDGREAWHAGGPYRTKREAVAAVKEAERELGKSRNPRRRTMRLRVRHRRPRLNTRRKVSSRRNARRRSTRRPRRNMRIRVKHRRRPRLNRRARKTIRGRRVRANARRKGFRRR